MAFSLGSTRPRETVGEVLRGFLGDIGAVWSFQITAIDGRALTVGKVVIAVLVVAVGAPIARTIIRRVSRRLLGRVGIKPGEAEAFATLGFYVVLACLVVFALWVAEIPLTVFTLAGGALAIGIGFGSQNILNNFISGLILLAERPIKVGDLIEVNETFGRVESIGARSTAIKTSSNFHIIVPNSTFLESNVVNWTHADNLVRISLVVGVAYGSPVRRVEEIILEEVLAHEKTVTPPDPVVLFGDFGDSALIFDPWISEGRCPISAIGSMIDSAKMPSSSRSRSTMFTSTPPARCGSRSSVSLSIEMPRLWSIPAQTPKIGLPG